MYFTMSLNLNRSCTILLRTMRSHFRVGIGGKGVVMCIVCVPYVVHLSFVAIYFLVLIGVKAHINWSDSDFACVSI